MSKKIFVISGESSGDLQGGTLIARLKTLRPEWRFFGVGGIKTQKAGAILLEDSTSFGVIGITTALAKFPQMVQKYLKLKKTITREKPDLVVLIDSPALNMRLAHLTRKLNIPTIYFFPPSAMIRNPKRIHKIFSLVDGVIPVFKFTAQYYEELGLPVNYFGHPLLDILLGKNDPPKTQTNQRILGILPGSRVHEVKALLPTMLKTAEKIHREHPDVSFVLPLAQPYILELVEKELQKYHLPIRIEKDNPQAALKQCEVILTSSGSVTLEAAILGIPMVVIYRLPWLDWNLAKIVVKTDWIALPNILLKQSVIPELLQEQATPELIFPVLDNLLKNHDAKEEMTQNLRKVKEFLGEPGATDRIADFILNFLDNEKH